MTKQTTEKEIVESSSADLANRIIEYIKNTPTMDMRKRSIHYSTV